jgi:hypothetical protein
MQLPSTTSQRLADAGIDGSTSSSKSTFSSRLKAAAGSLQAYLQTGVQKLQPSLARAWPFVAFIILSMSGSYCSKLQACWFDWQSCTAMVLCSSAGVVQ